MAWWRRDGRPSAGRWWRGLALAAAALLLPAILGAWREAPMSILDPAGPTASHITTVWWVMFWVSLAVTVLVVGLALYATLRDPDRRVRPRSGALVVSGGIVLPGVAIVGLLAYGIPGGYALLPVEDERPVFTVEVRGHQWWWEVTYPEAEGGPLHSANLLHIPAGRPVDVHVSAEDVIHSFWLPRLGGKIDGIPGRVNVFRIEADEPGEFRGQCAEFCGAQHARMALFAEAHDEDGLEAQLAALAAAGREPFADDDPGAIAFADNCAICHSVDPQIREPGIGPNLAGLAERPWLGAGTLPNGEEGLREWLHRHHELKPGNRMPPQLHLGTETLDAIATWLLRGRS
jgi:cytochrome c oxidase subunit II